MIYVTSFINSNSHIYFSYKTKIEVLKTDKFFTNALKKYENFANIFFNKI